MTFSSIPWLELAILIPMIGAVWLVFVHEHDTARSHQLTFSWGTFICSSMAWLLSGGVPVSPIRSEPERMMSLTYGFFAIDDFNAPLIPLAALLWLMTALGTLGTKPRQFSFSGNLLSEAVAIATLSCTNAWGIILLLGLAVIPPYFDFRVRGNSPRVFLIHMLSSLGMITLGWSMIDAENVNGPHSTFAIALLMGGIFIRCGVAPAHCWMTDLFENASLGSSLLFVTPMTGAYAAVRLLFPVATSDQLYFVMLMGLATSVYAGGMSLVQTEARRFFCYLFLSHSALVLVGLGVANPIGITAALSIWLSVGLALAGFGMTLRSLEARLGRLSLREYHGLYEHMPRVAVFFLLTGLASVGFPGTVGFVATDLLVDGAVQAYPWIGMLVVVAATLNGIAVVHAYFRLFTGHRHAVSIPIRSRPRELTAVLVMSSLILLGGIVPQPGIASRYAAATELIKAKGILPTRHTSRENDTSDGKLGISLK
jgi:NADH-quinone oxidoreductase subunit M